MLKGYTADRVLVLFGKTVELDNNDEIREENSSLACRLVSYRLNSKAGVENRDLESMQMHHFHFILDAYHIKLDILLSKSYAFVIKLNVFQTKTSFLQVKLQAVQDGWNNFNCSMNILPPPYIKGEGFLVRC